VLGQLMLEAFTFPTGAATVWEPQGVADEARQAERMIAP